MPLALVLTLLVHLPSLGGELVYDDMLMVAQNPMLQDWGSIGQAFQGAYWDFLDPDQASRIGYWRPLTAVALTLGWSLGDGAPGAFHGLSIAVHLLATAAALSAETVAAAVNDFMDPKTALGKF